MTLPISTRRRWLGGALALALIAGAGWAAHTLAWRSALQRGSAEAGHRLDVAAARLDGELARFDYLPSLLETSPEVFQLLAAPENRVLREQVSRTLAALNAIAGADILYVLDTSGTAVAAADWDQPGTPYGQDLSYRPYVRDALARGRGRFYGVGITSGRAGYYLSYALPRRGQPRGVATVKVNLEAREQEWRKLPGDLVVLDERGVVILASRPGWKFHPLTALTEAARAEAAQARSYGNADLSPLAWQVLQPLDEGISRVRFEGATYLASERAVNHGGWRFILLDGEGAAQASARNVALSGALAGAVLLLVMVVVWQGRREIRQQLANRAALQSANDTLEAKVQERTAELRAAQHELVHAGKLAVLGQMSAGIVHELNQPLAAMRTLSDNAAVLLEQGRPDEARRNLARVAQLTDRLARLTYQLKAFAHKSDEPAEPVAVRKAVGESMFLLAQRLGESDIAVTVDVSPPELAVLAETMRLEQVLGNLIGNAVDALAAAALRRIDIHARAEGDRVRIRVANTGPPIAAEVLPRLFEPFVTTKPAGKGLGLGLMISAHIVRGFGGTLQARNLEPAGVEFAIELPAAAAAA